MTTHNRTIANARVMALITLASRVLGLLRECVFSYFFSTAELLSAFRIAFMLPNLARRLFGEGALSAAMIPVLTDTLHHDGEDTARRFIGVLLQRVATILLVLVVLGEIIIAVWRLFQDDPALRLSSILLPYMILICMVAIVSGVLHVRGRFAVPAALPLLLNAAIITAIIVSARVWSLDDLGIMRCVCVAVLIAGVLQCMAVAGSLRRVGLWPTWRGGGADPAIRKVGRLMGPMVVGLSAVQINALADYVIAYVFISENGERVGPAVLGYAHFLYQMPLGVFGIALATAIFPVLAQMATRDDRAGLADVFVKGLRLSMFLAIPASVGLMMVAHPLVTVLYQRGAFTATDTQRVAGTLVFYAAGLTAYFTQHLIVRTFYALHDSKTPARIAMSMVAVNLAMNLVLVFPMQERGLALATAVSATLQVIWLLRILTRRVPDAGWRSVVRAIARMSAATAIMATALSVCLVPSLLGGLTSNHPPLHLALLLVVGVAVYAASARVLGIEELGLVTARRRDSG